MANIVLVPTGIAVTPTDQEVKMAIIAKAPVDAIALKKIWTQDMTQCATIATYDRNKNSRTMCHAGGSNFRDEYFVALASKISANTTVIIALGADAKPDSYTDRSILEGWKQSLEKAMINVGKGAANLQWVEFWQPAAALGQLRGTFVLQPDGSYGLKAL